MTIIYCQKFCGLKNFSLSDVKELSGQIVKAVLNIDSCGDKHKLTLESPKVPSAPSTTVRDLFSDLTPESVDSFKVFGDQYDSDVLWRIEIWKDNAPLENSTIHCRNIQDLPSKPEN
ncbi:MAG: hypothetical protein FVQ79_03265 [Planctomycetes bacterium]|nr:hypothetical protein [Planctomycetota bacterium]